MSTVTIIRPQPGRPVILATMQPVVTSESKRARRFFVRTAASSFFRALSGMRARDAFGRRCDAHFEAVNLLMRCVYCSKRAGLIRRVCTLCAKVVAIVDRAGGEVGLAGLVDIFVEEGLTREQVDAVLDTQVGASLQSATGSPRA